MMPSERSGTIARRSQLAGAAETWGFAAYVTLSVLIYLVVRTHTPIIVSGYLPQDDTLFMRLAEHLAAGEWLGPYDQSTLVKGPGFPLFLAVVHWSGLSVSLAIALFHSLAVMAFALVCRRLIGSTLLTGLLFTLLLWHPLALSTYLLRVFREDIYYAQLLLVLAGLIGALFVARTVPRKLGFAVLAGLTFGWFWLTREEGLWVGPALAILLTAGVVCAVFRRQFGSYAAIFGVIFGVFFGVNVAYRAVNSAEYGMFIGVDVNETNYLRALGAINSVRSGEIQPFISITHSSREHVYAISRAFASLKDYFEGGGGRGWAAISCRAQGTPCNEIGAGHFMWALREAAALKGHYSSPAAASAFFGVIADEIEAACATGALACERQAIAEMPPVTLQMIRDTLTVGLVFRAFGMLLLVTPPLEIEPSAGEAEDIARLVAFLNYPLIEPAEGADPTADSGGLLDTLSGVIRTIDLRLYQLVLVPVVLLGLVAFVAAPFAYIRRFAQNLCYILAAVSWILVLSRVGFLILMSVTAIAGNSVLTQYYLAPAHFLLVCAAVLSIAAWRQLARPAAEPSRPVVRTIERSRHDFR